MTQHITLISHVLHENCIKYFVKGPISSQAVPNLSETDLVVNYINFFYKRSDLVPDFIRSNKKDRYPRKLYQICRKKAYLVSTCIEYFAQDRPCHKLYGPNVVVFCCAQFDTRRVYLQPVTSMMTSSNGNIFRVTGQLCGSPVNSPHKGQWRGALMFSLICARINDWVNNGEAGGLRRHRPHYDAIVMSLAQDQWCDCPNANAAALKHMDK